MKSIIADLRQIGLFHLAKEIKAVETTVTHEGILNVPKGENIKNLSLEHFKSVIETKGWAKVSRAFMNLVRWNKKQNPSLSEWAYNTQEKLGEWVDNERQK